MVIFSIFMLTRDPPSGIGLRYVSTWDRSGVAARTAARLARCYTPLASHSSRLCLVLDSHRSARRDERPRLSNAAVEYSRGARPLPLRSRPDPARPRSTEAAPMVCFLRTRTTKLRNSSLLLHFLQYCHQWRLQKLEQINLRKTAPARPARTPAEGRRRPTSASSRRPRQV